MKKIFFLIGLILILSYANGQVDWSIFAGPQATAARYTILNQKQKNEVKYGFHAGVGLKTAFENNLLFAPELFYSLKGYKVTFAQFVNPPDTAALNNNTSIHTIEMAALLQYNLGKAANHFYIKFGPSLEFNIYGKEKFDLKSGGTVDRKMKFDFNGNYGYVGGNLLLQLGYETGNGFFVSTQYTHGAASINNEDGGPKIRHRVYGLTIGKYLRSKKVVLNTKNKE
ncbi:MAG: PorT family protein [Bacteroidetes bacterium]|nr:PorT family protein [Bacteroidota bacterium]